MHNQALFQFRSFQIDFQILQQHFTCQYKIIVELQIRTSKMPPPNCKPEVVASSKDADDIKQVASFLSKLGFFLKHITRRILIYFYGQYDIIVRCTPDPPPLFLNLNTTRLLEIDCFLIGGLQNWFGGRSEPFQNPPCVFCFVY